MIAKGSGTPLLLSFLPLLGALSLSLLISLPIYLVIISLIPPPFTLYFFRDPERVISEGIVSPADGKIVHLNRDKNEIDIFMNVWDVHVNRSPWNGEVKRTVHELGGHLPAFTSRPDKNEHRLLRISTEQDHGQIKLWQITGCFARRIVPYVEESDSLKKGEKIGIIRFGSRVRLIFSDDVDFEVEQGERVKAGETKLGTWR